MLNYIAKVDVKPRLLLIGEYRVDDINDDGQKRAVWLAEMDDLCRKEIRLYAEMMKKLLRNIGTRNVRISILIGKYSGIPECHEVAVFLPKALGHDRIVRTLYTIIELNRGVPPDQINVTLGSKGLKEYRLSDEMKDYSMSCPLRTAQRGNPL